MFKTLNFPSSIGIYRDDMATIVPITGATYHRI